MGATARFQKYRTQAVNTSTSSTSLVSIGSISSFNVTMGTPVFFGLMPDPGSSSDITSIGVDGPTVTAGSRGTEADAFFHLLRSGTIISRHWFGVNFDNFGLHSANAQGNFPLSMIWTIDALAPVGSYTYEMQAYVSSGSTLFINNAMLVAWEH